MSANQQPSRRDQAIIKRFALLFFLCALPLFCQTNTGELRLKVADPSGLAVKATVQIVSEANQYNNTFVTDDAGNVVAKRLSYGSYLVEIHQPGFADVSQTIEIRSALPTDVTFTLVLSSVKAAVTVKADDTLLDPEQAGSVNEIGPETIQHRVTSLPGRSMQDLVNMEPGWLYEGNAVLHPRGSEYQTQFVVNGIPLTDNRSPSFGPEISADDVDSVSIYTAGIPAEYGRKMGGVIEVNTLHDTQPGFHGQVILSGGSYDTAGAFAQGQYVWGKNTLGFSAAGAGTDHYLNPVVPENFTNNGTTGDFSINYERDFSPSDRLSLMVRHELSRYALPNELVQQTWCYPPGQTTGGPCQQQTANNFETMGIISYRHLFSPNIVADFNGMVRNNANNFASNALSTPIILFQNNWFNEGYFKGMVTIAHGRNEWKVGVESDNLFLNESFRYIITDPSQFDDDTALTFNFPGAFPSQGNRPDLEQSAFVQDLVHLGNWTLSLGLRWDHYQLVVNQNAVEPRVAVSRYFPSAGLIVHFSYDRVFQTPSFENLLLSSSPQAVLINPDVLSLPVKASEGNYYEAGISKGFGRNVKLDANYYRRTVNNYADDDQIQNTTISFPIAFQSAIIYGAEAKIEVPDWRGFSGYASYSYMVGNAWFPVTGGLFLGDDAMVPTSGHFPDSQDQRNTVRARGRYQINPRFWIAGGLSYDTGLPFEFEGTIDEAIATYGQAVVNRINFARGRIYPYFQVNASAGATVYKSERFNVRFQADGINLTNVLAVIDFGGLFSGNAIGPARSFALRLTTDF
jgi:Carboxypeptidase regulatory-like domain